VIKLASKGLVLIAGLLVLPCAGDPDQQLAGLSYGTGRTEDPRLTRLQQFFEDRGAPASEFALDFLIAADENELDWRLLPSISLLESGGGKNCKNNNILGWDNCERKFDSVQDGIYTVARRLRTSKLYKDKDLDELLDTYNPHGGYAEKVKKIMALLGPPDLSPELSLAN